VRYDVSDSPALSKLKAAATLMRFDLTGRVSHTLVEDEGYMVCVPLGFRCQGDPEGGSGRRADTA
jgi:hypothetical protein